MRGPEGLMALASSGVRFRRRRILLALALSCQGCGLQNWRLWRLRRLCSVMAGGTARPAAAEGEAGHEPGTGWPGRRWLRSGEARARIRMAGGRPSRQARHMVNPRCRDAVPLFRDHFVRPIEGSAGSPMLWRLPNLRFFRGFCTVFVASAQFPWFLHGIRIFAIWSCGCDSGISQWYRVGDAGALRAEPKTFVLRGQKQNTMGQNIGPRGGMKERN